MATASDSQTTGVYTYNRKKCDDQYTNGHFCCFDCLLTVFDHWCANRHRSTKTVPTVYQQCANRKKQSKDSKNRENDRVLLCCLLTVLFFYNFLMACVRLSLNSSLSASLSLIVIDLPRLYQPCTKSIPKTVKRQSKQQKSSLAYQSSHVYSESAEYTKPLHPDSVDGLLFVHGLKH